MRKLVVGLSLYCIFINPVSSPAQPAASAPIKLAQAGSMPSWTVPVLRLVSATHVEPTTGVVIADSGLVIVPADFATFGDEIVVLDGGTDIIRNGRPAEIVQRFPLSGLQVLSVESLKRRGAAFSATPLEEGSQIRLHAFPPAEMIARGEPPLDIESSVKAAAENGKFLITPESPLPNVTGALVDPCGNLAGYSSANGVQSMSTSEAPRYQWRDELALIMAEMQLKPRIADCRGIIDKQQDAAEPQSESKPEQAAVTPAPEPDSLQPEVEEPAVTASDEVQSPEPTGMEPTGLEETVLEEMDQLPPIEAEPSVVSDTEESIPDGSEAEKPAGRLPWLWLVAALLLFGGGLAVHWTRARKNAQSISESDFLPPPGSDQSSEEPDQPELDQDGMDSTLTIEGQMADGTGFTASCRVSGNAINVVIGRGNEDLNINSPTVSRRHASLNGTCEKLTISDLGSSNGTSINGVPCLEGETMFVQPEDTIILGNCRFRFQVTRFSQAPE